MQPPHLASIEDLWFGEVHEVLVVGDDVDRGLGVREPVMEEVEWLDDGEGLLVSDVIVITAGEDMFFLLVKSH